MVLKCIIYFFSYVPTYYIPIDPLSVDCLLCLEELLEVASVPRGEKVERVAEYRGLDGGYL